MTLGTAAVFYLALGAAVAFAVYLSDECPAGCERAFRLATSLFFWPLHLPLLLQQAARVSENAMADSQAKPADSLTQAIAQVESELDAALKSLDGWAEGVLADEQRRLHELRVAWRIQAERIRELDQLLANPEFLATGTSDTGPTERAASTANRRERSDLGRLANIRRLQELRDRMFSDFQGTLAWVRELATMIHLAKFSGAPASRGEELIAQIAAAVEGLREASDWRDLEPSTERTAAMPAAMN